MIVVNKEIPDERGGDETGEGQHVRNSIYVLMNWDW